LSLSRSCGRQRRPRGAGGPGTALLVGAALPPPRGYSPRARHTGHRHGHPAASHARRRRRPSHRPLLRSPPPRPAHSRAQPHQPPTATATEPLPPDVLAVGTVTLAEGIVGRRDAPTATSSAASPTARRACDLGAADHRRRHHLGATACPIPANRLGGRAC
jgi:hypothetical protein